MNIQILMLKFIMVDNQFIIMFYLLNKIVIKYIYIKIIYSIKNKYL